MLLCAVVGALLQTSAAGAQSEASFPPWQFEAANRTIRLGSWEGVLAEGTVQWPGINSTASFAVLPALVSATEVAALLAALPHEDFDVDADSVDEMATFEFYLEKNGSVGEALRSIPGKPEQRDAAVLERRRPARERLAAITGPIFRERLTPFINARVPACAGGRCKPCFSLVRRYLPHERTTHETHFDIQSLATVVVGLNSAGADFEGGLYVSTGAWRRYLPLQRGDAVVHGSELLHGVQTREGGGKARWSWITWYKDAGDGAVDCGASRPAAWHAAAAEAGDPLAQFLQSHRAHMVGDNPEGGKAAAAGKAAASKAKLRAKWLRRSAKGGFARAQNELAMAYKTGDGVRLDRRRALKWFKKAAKARRRGGGGGGGGGGLADTWPPEPDAMFNLGQMLLEDAAGDDAVVARAVGLFERAAESGSRLAMYNMGVACSKGAGGAAKDAEEARRWFERAGTAASMHQAATIWAEPAPPQRPAASHADANRLFRRAALAGHAPAAYRLGLRLLGAGEEAAGGGEGGATVPAAEAPAAAEPWLRRAAMAGDASAQFALAQMLSVGKGGVKKDAAMAERLVHAAARGGSQEARRALQQRQEL
jgi:TPR repeat protein